MRLKCSRASFSPSSYSEKLPWVEVVDNVGKTITNPDNLISKTTLKKTTVTGLVTTADLNTKAT